MLGFGIIRVYSFMQSYSRNIVLPIRRLSSRHYATTTCSNNNNNSNVNPPQQQDGKKKQRFQKYVARENRIAILEELSYRSLAQEAELNGLLEKQQQKTISDAVGGVFEEQYDPFNFSVDHHAFKEAHNEAFCQLARYCQETSKEPNWMDRMLLLQRRCNEHNFRWTHVLLPIATNHRLTNWSNIGNGMAVVVVTRVHTFV
jgi:hypothetical protein